MTLKPILDVLDFAVLIWIALMERAALTLDRANHLLYKNFFEQRARWYSARGKTKAPETSGGNELTGVVREEDSTDEETT